MPSYSKALCLAGSLRKSHKGQAYSTKNTKRWFRVGGFHLEYFDDTGKRLGCFDLRNVTEMRPATDSGAGTSGLDFVLSMGSNETRLLTISFEGAEPHGVHLPPH